MLKVIQKQTYILMLVCLGFLAFAGVNGGVYADNHTNTNSLTEETKVSADVDQVLNVSLPSNLVELKLDPSTTPYKSTDFYVFVSTNNDTGYYMTVSSESSDLLNTSNAAKTIPTISAEAAQSGWSIWNENSETNRWAYAVNGSSYKSFVSGTNIASYDTLIENHRTQITFGAKVDYSQPAGVYKTEMDFLAIANPTIMAIQDLDAAYCTDTPLVVMDARDGEEYTIQRLADGKCWMLDNLRFDPATVPLGAMMNRTNAPNEALKYLKNGGGSEPFTANAVSGEWSNEDYGVVRYASPYVEAAYKNTVSSSTHTIASGKTGVFYDYCAATAGTYCYPSDHSLGDAEHDVCPTGWRMPRGGEADNERNDLNKLYLAYGSDAEALNAALNISYAGEFNTQRYGVDTNAFFWTSTRYNDAMVYELYTNSSLATNVSFTSERRSGHNVRCVMKARASGYLQDVTLDMLADAETNTEYTFKDKRDNEEYRVAKLADGNFWLVDNLRLDPTVVTLEKLQGNTNATDETLTYYKNGGGSSSTDMYPVSGVVNENGQPYSIYSPSVIVGKKNTTVQDMVGTNTSKVGVYYNSCAASAGSACGDNSAFRLYDLAQDVCPSGWRLPTGYTTGEYKALYDLIYKSELDYNVNVANFLSPLNFPQSGNNGSTSSGHWFWTSRHSGSSDLYIMEANMGSYSDGRLWYSVNFYEDKGHSNKIAVRCIFTKKDITSITYLQDITPTIVRDTAVGTTATLIDKRDNEEYRVARLNDGNVWILENLRLDLSAVPLGTLQGNTNAPNDALGYLKNGGGTSPYAVNAISTDSSTLTDEYTSGHIEIAHKDIVETTHYGDNTSKVGVYYNYCAASGGTVCSSSNYNDTQYDICPSGWKMPRNTNSSYADSGNNDLQHLYRAYKSDLTLMNTAFNTIPSNGYYASHTNYEGGGTNNLYIWTSSYESSGSARLGIFGPNQSSIYYGGTDRTRAFSVRCMAKVE